MVQCMAGFKFNFSFSDASLKAIETENNNYPKGWQLLLLFVHVLFRQTNQYLPHIQQQLYAASRL